MNPKPLCLAAILAAGVSCSNTDSTTADGGTDTVTATVARPATVHTTEAVPTETEGIVKDTDESEKIKTQNDMELLKTFYDKCVFNAGDPTRYCTPKCLKKLADANEYDDGGYATYEFRTMEQDGNGSSKVLDVQPAGDRWYTVTYRDMGTRGVTRVLVTDGKIADYKRITPIY